MVSLEPGISLQTMDYVEVEPGRWYQNPVDHRTMDLLSSVRFDQTEIHLSGMEARTDGVMVWTKWIASPSLKTSDTPGGA